MWKKIQEVALAALTKLGKSLAVKVVQKEGDKLQAQVKEAFLVRGIVRFDTHFDQWQDRLARAVQVVKFLPGTLKDKALEVIKDEGDKLQAKVHEAAEGGGPDAIDKAFDTAQAAIIERIGKL